MRLISQDGLVDIPYEHVSLHIVYQGSDMEFCIYAHHIQCSYEKFVNLMGIYESREKALKVMEMVRNDYLSYLQAANSPYAFIQPKVFQFPKDEDVEV